MEKPRLSFWQMFNMSFGFLGIQFGWGLQLANMSAVYERLGARPDEVPLLWLAAPMTGLLVQPIVESIHKLIATFNPEFQDRLRNNVLLAGGGGLMRGLNVRIEEAMKQIGGGKVTVVDEPLYAGANGALQLAMDMPSEYWQQLR